MDLTKGKGGTKLISADTVGVENNARDLKKACRGGTFIGSGGGGGTNCVEKKWTMFGSSTMFYIRLVISGGKRNLKLEIFISV